MNKGDDLKGHHHEEDGEYGIVMGIKALDREQEQFFLSSIKKLRFLKLFSCPGL